MASSFCCCGRCVVVDSFDIGGFDVNGFRCWCYFYCFVVAYRVTDDVLSNHLAIHLKD